MVAGVLQFPPDFMFRLNQEEAEALVSQYEAGKGVTDFRQKSGRNDDIE